MLLTEPAGCLLQIQHQLPQGLGCLQGLGCRDGAELRTFCDGLGLLVGGLGLLALGLHGLTDKSELILNGGYLVMDMC